MNKIIYWIFGILSFVLLLTTLFIFFKFNSPNTSTDIFSGKILFGEPVLGDLNGDGLIDKAVWLIEEPGGSGTFFYAELLINTGSAYKTTNAVFLGDRIAPQTLEIKGGQAIYNFAERKVSDPMTTPPSIGKSVWVNYNKKTNEIIESTNSNIYVSYPKDNDKISTPLIIKGEARTWYFEASFPVILTDWDGVIIAQGTATAESDWMTTNFVPFTATLNFTKPSYGERGFLILKKDNPSGLPQNDDSIEIPVNFK
jgi:hypothetical protein